MTRPASLALAALLAALSLSPALAKDQAASQPSAKTETKKEAAKKDEVVDEEKESVIFYRSAQSTGISGLSAFHTSHTASDTVVVTTLRKSVEQYKIDSIDFLKIDTEGFDKFVLEGIPWETHAPITLVAEFEDAKTRPLGYDFVDFATYIASKGYQLMVSEWEPIVAYGTQHSWSDFKPYPCKLNTPQAWGNFIASLDTAVFSRITDECQRIKHKLN